MKLFAAALQLPVDPVTIVPMLLAEGVDGLGERLVRLFLSVWDATPGQGPMLAMVRSAVSHEQAATLLREFLTDVVVGPVARAVGDDRPELRASLVASQMIGLAMARYVVRIEPLAIADADTVAAVLGPTVQRYLSGALDRPPR